MNGISEFKQKSKDLDLIKGQTIEYECVHYPLQQCFHFLSKQVIQIQSIDQLMKKNQLRRQIFQLQKLDPKRKIFFSKDRTKSKQNYFLNYRKEELEPMDQETILKFQVNPANTASLTKEISLMSPNPMASAKVSNRSNIEDVIEIQNSNTKRSTGSLLCFWIIVLCTAAIPIINLLLFFLQPYELANVTKASLVLDGLGRSDDFTYFYIVMGVYAGITIAFVFYSCFFTHFCQRVKLFLLVDNILICMLATDVAYVVLHVVCFTAVYSTDQQSNLEADYQILWQDILVILEYCLTNLAFVGIFRVMMSNIQWKSWQTVIYKLAIIVSSLAYVVMGLVYIFGKDSLSAQVDDFNKDLQEVFNELYASSSSSDLGLIPYYQRMQGSLTDSKSKIASFIIFYVFTNFAFSFEVIAKLSDFDGTAELKTHYRLQEPEAEELQPPHNR